MMMKAVAAAAFAALLPISYVASTRAAEPRPDEPRVMNVTTFDFAFEAPASIQAGTITIRLVNKGKELHHVQLIKLEQGKTFADVQAAMQKHGPPPSWMVDVGGPNVPFPGQTSEAALTLEPGNYMLICFVDTPDRKPHFMKGMVKELKVTGPATKTAEPKADLTMTLDDYDFRFSKPIAAGKQTIRLENVASQTHELVIVKLNPGKSVPDVLTWLFKPDGAPPGAPMGGSTGIAKGRRLYVTATFEPGRYGLICFVPDAKDGKPHLEHGMMKEFDVK
jgi:hypothetical protein